MYAFEFLFYLWQSLFMLYYFLKHLVDYQEVILPHLFSHALLSLVRVISGLEEFANALLAKRDEVKVIFKLCGIAL